MMRVIRLFLIVTLFTIGFSYRGICDFNPFEQRKIVIGHFENRGEKKYDYVKESLEQSLYDYALLIPFVTLSDEEIAILKNLSAIEKYQKLLEQADGKIRYSMEPSVTRKEPAAETFPISISGYYTVHSEAEVSLFISAYSSLTKKVFADYETTRDLFSIMNRSEVYLIPFFKRFLRYKTHTVSVSASPSDSLLFIDGRLIGIGKSGEILISPGYHRITVRREGYKSFSDLIHIEKDGYEKQVVLRKLEEEKPVLITAVPPGTKVYTSGRFKGTTPLSIRISSEDRTLTFVKKGYVNRTIPAQEILEAKQKYRAELITEEARQKILKEAELHRKSSETLYYTGIGMLGLSIILGIERTANLQKADLYSGTDPAKYNEALSTTSTLTYLTAASSAITAGIFIFSFIEMLNYFDLYNFTESASDGNILKKEVRF